MKIYIGPYKNWFGPYQLAEKLMFWTDKYEDDRVHAFGHFLATGKRYDKNEVGKMSDDSETLLYRFLKWVDSFKKRRVYIKIDKYDTWSMDNTLAHIILPMLKQMQATKHGGPQVDDEDVPEELKSTSAPAKENEWDTDEHWFKRWDWILGEMIFAFECKLDDSWQDKFRSGEHDLIWIENKEHQFANPKTGVMESTYRMEKGPNDTYECDYEGMKVVETRIQNGFRLFGKYYQALWD
jgi:hypothetical protein